MNALFSIAEATLEYAQFVTNSVVDLIATGSQTGNFMPYYW